MQDKLSAAEQQVRQDEEKIAANAEQMLKDKQFIEEIQEKLLERNQRVVQSIKATASKFDLNEQLVDSAYLMNFANY
jgi:phosphoenolpyruvate-protein kinase (PTS system EI component)